MSPDKAWMSYAFTHEEYSNVLLIIRQFNNVIYDNTLSCETIFLIATMHIKYLFDFLFNYTFLILWNKIYIFIILFVL